MGFTPDRFGKAGRSGALLLAGLTLACAQAHADERAQALLQRVQETLAQTQTLSAQFTTQSVYPTRYRDTQEKGTVLLARPNRVRIQIDRFRKPENADVWKATGNGSVVVTDGSAVWTLIRHPQSAQYRQAAANAAQTHRLLDSIEPLRGFFSGNGLSAGGATYVGTRSWENADYEVVSLTLSEARGPAKAASGEAEVYIGGDSLIHRFVLHAQGKEGLTLREVVLHQIRRDAPITATAFAFTPPPDAAPFERTPPTALLAAGTTAPDFTVEDGSGKTVRLSDLHGKVVVLKFWATWCWSCKQSLPHTNAIARRYADKDVVVLAVDIWDSKKAFQSWLSRRLGYDYIRFAIDPQPQGRDVATALYHVSTTPTQYVIDKDGKIVAALEGYDGPTDQLEAALHAAGVLLQSRAASVSVLAHD